MKGKINVGAGLLGGERRGSTHSSTSPNREVDYLEVSKLQEKFDSFCKTSESMTSLLNVKAIKQRFADFQMKLKQWRLRDKQRKRLKKQFTRNVTKLTDVMKYALSTF